MDLLPGGSLPAGAHALGRLASDGAGGSSAPGRLAQHIPVCSLHYVCLFLL